MAVTIFIYKDSCVLFLLCKPTHQFSAFLQHAENLAGPTLKVLGLKWQGKMQFWGARPIKRQRTAPKQR